VLGRNRSRTLRRKIGNERRHRGRWKNCRVLLRRLVELLLATISVDRWWESRLRAGGVKTGVLRKGLGGRVEAKVIEGGVHVGLGKSGDIHRRIFLGTIGARTGTIEVRSCNEGRRRKVGGRSYHDGKRVRRFGLAV
jgi:hypothetical protein